jgi:hypothetical protein
VLRYRNAHFNRDASPIVLNLSAYSIALSISRKKLRRSPGSFPPAKSVVFAGCAGGARAERACVLDLDLRLEYRHGLADDPDTLDGAVLDFELHVHTPGPVQLVPLHAAE